MASTVGRYLCRRCPAIVAAATVLFTAGCSLVAMPSSQSPTGRPKQAQSSPEPSASQAKLAGPAQQTATAAQSATQSRTLSVYVSEQVGGAEPMSWQAQVVERRAPMLAYGRYTANISGLRLAYTAIIDGTATYMRFSTPVVVAPKPWIELVSPQQNELGGLLDSIISYDPTALSQPLLTCKDVHLVGHQEVAGVPTSEYRALLTPSAALAAMPTAQQAVLAPATTTVRGDIQYLIWIAPGSQIRKMRVIEHTAHATVTITETIRWYDRPAIVTVPPTGKVAPEQNIVIKAVPT
jgi:hypothetical protein